MEKQIQELYDMYLLLEVQTAGTDNSHKKKINSFWIITFSSCPPFTPRISLRQLAKGVFFVGRGRVNVHGWMKQKQWKCP